MRKSKWFRRRVVGAGIAAGVAATLAIGGVAHAAARPPDARMVSGFGAAGAVAASAAHLTYWGGRVVRIPGL